MFSRSSFYQPPSKQVWVHFTSNYLSVCLPSASDLCKDRDFAYWFLLSQSICCRNEQMNDRNSLENTTLSTSISLSQTQRKLLSFKATVFVNSHYIWINAHAINTPSEAKLEAEKWKTRTLTVWVAEVGCAPWVSLARAYHILLHAPMTLQLKTCSQLPRGQARHARRIKALDTAHRRWWVRVGG